MPSRGPFVPIPLTCQVNLVGHNSSDNRPVVNVIHCECPASPSAAYLTAIGDLFALKWTTKSGSWSSNMVLDTIVVTDLNSASGPQVTVDVASAGTGGNGLPNLCGVIELLTAKRGKSFTGRIFMPIPTANVNAATGLLVATVQANMDDFVDQVQTGLAALAPSSTIVVASRKLRASTAITGPATRAKAGFIRRRTFG